MAPSSSKPYRAVTEEAIMMKARPARNPESQLNHPKSINSTPINKRKHTIVQLLPPSLQTPQLLLALLIRVIRLQAARMARHRLVHRHHDAERPSSRGEVESERGAEPGEFSGGEGRLVAVQVGGDGQDEVGEGAGAVERREELLRVVQEVGGHGAGVVRGDVAELQHGHDEGGLQDGAAWGLVWLDCALAGLVGGVEDTEVDGCADYCEGLCGVSCLHGLIVSSLLSW